MTRPKKYWSEPQQMFEDDESISGSEYEPLDHYAMELQIESQRILYAMSNMVTNMEAAACLPLLLDHQHILREHLTEEQLEEVNSSCAKYLGKPNSNFKSISMKQSSKVAKNDLHKIDPKIDPRLATAINIIINCVSLRPFVESLLPKISEAAHIFLDNLRKLNEVAINRLSIAAEDEVERERKLRLAWKHNERTKAMIYEVTQKLQEQRSRLRTSLEAKEMIVNQHKATIAMINQKGQQETWRRVQDSEEDMMLDSKASEERQEILLEEAKSAQAQYDKLIQQHIATEKDLRAKKTKVESQLISWLNKYDTDIGERQRELDEINEEYDAEKAEFDKLQEMFEKQEKEYNALMAEKEEEERKEMEAKLYAFLCHRAQRRIQQAVKAYKQRKIDRKKERALRLRKLKEAKALLKLQKHQKAAEKKKQNVAKPKKRVVVAEEEEAKPELEPEPEIIKEDQHLEQKMSEADLQQDDDTSETTEVNVEEPMNRYAPATGIIESAEKDVPKVIEEIESITETYQPFDD